MREYILTYRYQYKRYKMLIKAGDNQEARRSGLHKIREHFNLKSTDPAPELVEITWPGKKSLKPV